MRIYCTVCEINSQRKVKGGQHTIWSDSIASSCCHLFAWKFFPEWKHFVVSINVPPPQLCGGEHSKLCFNHVSVSSQSVTRIRLSHTILAFVTAANVIHSLAGLGRIACCKTSFRSQTSLLTIINPEAKITPPPSLVNEGYKGVDVRPARPAAHYHAGLDYW